MSGSHPCVVQRHTYAPVLWDAGDAGSSVWTTDRPAGPGRGTASASLLCPPGHKAPSSACRPVSPRLVSPAAQRGEPGFPPGGHRRTLDYSNEDTPVAFPSLRKRAVDIKLKPRSDSSGAWRDSIRLESERQGLWPRGHPPAPLFSSCRSVCSLPRSHADPRWKRT
ncbi:hypothetical protein CapIbe_003340 [Capra ibex]